jgi:hypothetical protein
MFNGKRPNSGYVTFRGTAPTGIADGSANDARNIVKKNSRYDTRGLGHPCGLA